MPWNWMKKENNNGFLRMLISCWDHSSGNLLDSKVVEYSKISNRENQYIWYMFYKKFDKNKNHCFNFSFFFYSFNKAYKSMPYIS